MQKNPINWPPLAATAMFCCRNEGFVIVVTIIRRQFDHHPKFNKRTLDLFRKRQGRIRIRNRKGCLIADIFQTHIYHDCSDVIALFTKLFQDPMVKQIRPNHPDFHVFKKPKKSYAEGNGIPFDTIVTLSET